MGVDRVVFSVTTVSAVHDEPPVVLSISVDVQ
jgi:hypothetical protein